MMETMWNATRLAKLRREYSWRNTALLADELGIDVLRVRWRARLMGLKKDKGLARNARIAFLDEIMAEYASKTAPEIARERGVPVHNVRNWISEARYGIKKRGNKS